MEAVFHQVYEPAWRGTHIGIIVQQDKLIRFSQECIILSGRVSSTNIHMGLYEPIKSYSFLLIKCLNISVIYCAYVLRNIHGYENNLFVMGAEALSSYHKQADNTSLLQ